MPYGSKIFLIRPNPFGRVPMVLDGSNSFWLGLNCFEEVKIMKISPEKSNLSPSKMIWTQAKQIGLKQKTISTIHTKMY